MNRIFTTRAILFACMAVLAVGLFAACGATPTATPTAAPPTATKAPPIATALPAGPEKTPALGKMPPLYAAGYTIITGQPDAIDNVVAGIVKAPPDELKGITFDMVNQLPMAEWNLAPGTCKGLPPCLVPGKGAATRLYKLGGLRAPEPGPTDPTAKVIAKINEGSTFTTDSVCVYADPVYLTGDPPPDLAGGNPWIAGGSPWIAGGSGTGAPVPTNATFWGQWAFASQSGFPSNNVGIALSAAASEKPSPVRPGWKVRVGVFDTSPLKAPTDVPWVMPSLSLRVHTAQDLLQLSGRADISDHGLYVAGLVHAVAPSSTIELYQVLNNEGLGDLWTLNANLYAFITDTITHRGDWRGAVINLSLGLHPAAGETEGLPKQIVSLQTLVSAAHCEGIVVVAASGNESAGVTAQAPQIPASFDEAISVAASNMAGGRACYSNMGEVLAPGGEATNVCTGTYGIPSLISLVMKQSGAPDGYAFWAGTSFAAPLVSGLAALLVDQEVSRDSSQWLSPNLTLPVTVARRIMAGTVPSTDKSGMRIINVPNSLQ